MIKNFVCLLSISVIVSMLGCSPTASKDNERAPDKSLTANKQSTTDSTKASSSNTSADSIDHQAQSQTTSSNKSTDALPKSDQPNTSVTTDQSTTNTVATPNSVAERGDGDDVSAEPVVVAENKLNTEGEPVLDNGRDGAARPGGQPPTNTLTANPPVNVGNPLRSPSGVSKALPKEYEAMDKDNDGQIGVYEWPKEKLAEFSRLDANGDGFLTGQELGGEKGDANDPKSTSKAPERTNESGPDRAPPKTESKTQP